MHRYPIFVISKGRWKNCLTCKEFLRFGVDFRVVVEPQEYDFYKMYVPEEYILRAPENFSMRKQGGIPVRNFVWNYSKKLGVARHWVLDDNIRHFYFFFKGVKFNVDPEVAFRLVEDFADRYENIKMTGMNYSVFVASDMDIPLFLNTHVYSVILLSNDLDLSWRGRYNEDTDLNLQVLSKGYCLVSFNIVSAGKIATLTMKGGNTDTIYIKNGRLKMARELERRWPGIVRVIRRFRRTQHFVDWSRFDENKPIRRKDLDWNKIKKYRYHLEMIKVKKDIKKLDSELEDLYKSFNLLYN